MVNGFASWRQSGTKRDACEGDGQEWYNASTCFGAQNDR